MASLGTAVLNPGDSIEEGNWIESGNGLFRAGMTAKGAFVIYAFNSDEMKVLWRMEPPDPVPGSYLVLHGAGRIELHAPGDIVKSFRGCQSASTQEVCKFGTDFYLAMQDDGNLVLRGYVDNTPLVVWASDTVNSDATQSTLVIPGVLVLSIDQATIGDSTFDKTVLNTAGERVIVRAGSSQVILPPNEKCGVISNAGTVNVSSITYNFSHDMPDEDGPSMNESDAGPAMTYGPHQTTITISEESSGSGFKLT